MSSSEGFGISDTGATVVEGEIVTAIRELNRLRTPTRDLLARELGIARTGAAVAAASSRGRAARGHRAGSPRRRARGPDNLYGRRRAQCRRRASDAPRPRPHHRVAHGAAHSSARKASPAPGLLRDSARRNNSKRADPKPKFIFMFDELLRQ